MYFYVILMKSFVKLESIAGSIYSWNIQESFEMRISGSFVEEIVL